MKRKKMKNYNFEEKIHKDKAHIYQYLLGNILDISISISISIRKRNDSDRNS